MPEGKEKISTFWIICQPRRGKKKKNSAYSDGLFYWILLKHNEFLGNNKNCCQLILNYYGSFANFLTE